MNETIATVAVQTTFLQEIAKFMIEGGIFMWVILGVWIIGLTIALERAKALWCFDVNAKSLMNVVKKYVLLNDVSKAIQSCSNTKALLPQVIRSGLKRANQSKEQISDAVEATMLEVVPQIEKRLGHLGLVANVSTLFGLLGTIQGLIQSFSAVANADAATKAKLLATGISVAMNTTALGLLSAISIMVIAASLNSKAHKITAEIEEYAVKLVDLLGTKKQYVNVDENSDASLPPVNNNNSNVKEFKKVAA